MPDYHRRREHALTPLDCTSPETVASSLREATTFGDRAGTSPAWLIQQAWSEAPEVVEAGLALALAEGDDRVRSAVLTAARALPSGSLLEPLLAELPAWLDHPDPERPPRPLGRGLIEAAVEQRDLVVEDAVAERFGAGGDLLWRDASNDPCGAGAARLRAWREAGRPLGHLATTLGLLYAGSGRPCLAEVAPLIWTAPVAERRAFLRALGGDGAPCAPAKAALTASVAAALGAPGEGRFQEVELAPLEPVEAGWEARFRVVDDADAFSQYDRTTTWEGHAVLDPLATTVREGRLRVVAAGEASDGVVGREVALGAPPDAPDAPPPPQTDRREPTPEATPEPPPAEPGGPPTIFSSLDAALADAERATEVHADVTGLKSLPKTITTLRGVVHLGLARNKLATVPRELFALTRLRHLDLSDNKLRKLPQELGALTELLRLRLHGNKLAALPPEVGRLLALEELRLGGNPLSELPEGVGELAHLRELWLSGCPLSAVPEPLRRLRALEVLNLTGCPVGSLPDWVLALPLLRELRAGRCGLEHLPTTVGEAAALRHLDLFGNHLTALPAELGRLVGLETLAVGANHLARLPDAIGDLAGLRLLDLGGNRGLALPEAVGALRGLRELSLVGVDPADPEDLADRLRPLTALEALNLNSNRLARLPEALCALTGLRRLDLDTNALAALPGPIARLGDLRHLQLMDNALSEVPPALRDHPRLEALYLSGNRVETVPDWIADLPALRVLALARNPLAVGEAERLRAMRPGLTLFL